MWSVGTGKTFTVDCLAGEARVPVVKFNRGKSVWILASSSPDLIEVDLKRPGRIDIKIPLFPTASPRESFDLLRVLCQKPGVAISESEYGGLESLTPLLLTPGAAEALAVKVYRLVRTSKTEPAEALKRTDYQNPVPLDTMGISNPLGCERSQRS